MIITIANQKGGVAKTTTASVIWSELPNTLGIDLDTQCSFTITINADEDVPYTIYDVLTENCPIEKAVQKLSEGDFIASSSDLINVTTLPPLTLSKALLPLRGKYENIILDTPPFFSPATMNALSVADVLIIPILGDKLSLRGLEQMLEIVKDIQEETNPNLKIGGLLLTNFNARSILRRQMREYVEDFAAEKGIRVFKTAIRSAVAVPEAQAEGKSLFSYAPNANVTEDYKAFLGELKEVLANG